MCLNLEKSKQTYKNNTRIKHTDELEKNLGKNIKYILYKIYIWIDYNENLLFLFQNE